MDEDYDAVGEDLVWMTLVMIMLERFMFVRVMMMERLKLVKGMFVRG